MFTKITSKLNFSAEALAFQDRNWFASLATKMQAWIDSDYDEVTFTDEKIEEMVRSRFKFDELEIVMTKDNGSGYCVVPYIETSSHIFLAGFDPDLVKQYTMRPTTGYGWVDMNKLEVGGLFSKFRGKIICDAAETKSSSATGAMAAAVLCHEIGHVFQLMVMYADTMYISGVLRDTIPSIMNQPEINGKMAILTRLEKDAGVKITDKETLVNKNSQELYQTVIVDKLLHRPYSGYNSSLYDKKTWESMSDDFAARLGATLPLAKMMDNTHSRYKHIEKMGSIEYGVSVVSTFVIGTFVLPLFVVGCILGMQIHNPYGDTYDRPMERIAKLRQLLTAEMKQTKDADLKRILLLEMDQLDKILSEYKNHEGIMKTLWFLSSSTYRADRREMAAQKKLEELINNPLYDAAAKLDLAAARRNA